MASPRPVRIPRPSAPGTARAVRTVTVPRGPPSGPVETRVNRAGTRRAARLTFLFLVGVSAVYFASYLYDRGSPGGSSPGVETDLFVFGLVALALGFAGAVVSLGAAPRSVELTPDSIVVVGRWGGRTAWTPRSAVQVRVLRRYLPGVLASEPVESVELAGMGRRRTYLVEAGAFETAGLPGAN